MDPVCAIDRLLNSGARPLGRTIEAILDHPDRSLRVDCRLLPIEEMREPDPDRTLELVSDPRATCRAGPGPVHFCSSQGSFSFRLAWDRQVHSSYDTPANAQLMALLDLMARLLMRVHRSSQGGAQARPGLVPLLRQVQRYQRALSALGVRQEQGRPISSIVLEQDPRYQQLGRIRQSLRVLLREPPRARGRQL